MNNEDFRADLRKMTLEDARKSKVITDGLYLHLSELQGQYPNNLKLERGVFDA